MARQGVNLSGLGIFLVILSAAVLITGCSNPAKEMRDRVFGVGDARLKNVLQQSLAESGGIEAWGRLEYIHGQTLATVYEGEGGKALIEQQCRVQPGKKTIVSLTSNEPGGVQTEVLDRKGKANIHLQGPTKKNQQESRPEELYGSAIKLRVLAHAVMGPAGLLAKDLSLRYIGQERQGGRMMHKIEVTGDLLPPVSDGAYTDGNLLAVWIDDQTDQIRRIWLRYYKHDTTFGYLALDVGNYKKVSGGFSLPRYIAYTHSDRYQQFSQQQIMTIEFLSLQAELRKKDQKWFFE